MVFFRFQYTKLEKYWYVPIFPNLSIIMILGFRNHQYCWIDLASLCLTGTVPLKYNDPGFRGNSRSAVRFIWQLSSGNGCLSLVQFFLLCPTLEQMETKWATMMAVWLFRLRAGQGQNGPPPVRVVKTELHGPAFWLLAASYACFFRLRVNGCTHPTLSLKREAALKSSALLPSASDWE